MQKLSHWRAFTLALMASILLLPAVAMQFTDEMNWGAEDFVAAFALLAAAFLGAEGISRLNLRPGVKAIGVASTAGAVALIWAHLAVGVF